MALVDTSACYSHKEQHYAHTQDKENAVTAGLSAQKGKIPHMWEAKSHGIGTAPHEAICQLHKSESNIIRQPTPAWKGANGHSNTGKDRL